MCLRSTIVEDGRDENEIKCRIPMARNMFNNFRTENSINQIEIKNS